MSPEPAPDRAAVRRALAGLDPEEFVGFVAAVHGARGAVDSVERDGGVLAVHGDETRRILPLADRPGPLRGPAPVGPAVGPVDEVVAQADADAAREVAARRGARYRSPDDLYDRVRYGLPRDARRRLLSDRLDAEAGGGPGAVAGRVGRRRVALALAAALVVVAGLGAGAVPVDPPSVAPAASPAGSATPTPGAAAATGTEPAVPAGTAEADAHPDPYPPGVDVDGVTNAAALSRAHAAAAAARRYRWTVVEGRTPAAGAADLAADGPEAAVEVITRTANASGNVSFRTYSGEGYAYVGIAGPNGSRYVRETARRRSGEGTRDADRAAGYVDRYLAGAGGTVTRERAAGVTLYRLRLTDPPSRLAGAVSDYEATALVTRRGFVVVLDVSYRTRGPRDPTAVAFRFGYGPYRATEDPSWYEAARRAANGTVPVGGTGGE
ncbi:MAG: hypothetical protein ABEH40_02700 [Haloferacaceae archaeon]